MACCIKKKKGDNSNSSKKPRDEEALATSAKYSNDPKKLSFADDDNNSSDKDPWDYPDYKGVDKQGANKEKELYGEDDKPITRISGYGQPPFAWYPSSSGVQQIEYVRKLERDFENLQKAFLTTSTQFARMQFRMRQIMQANPSERDRLLKDLEKLEQNGFMETDDEMPRIQRDMKLLGSVRHKQHYIIGCLREQLARLANADDLDEDLGEENAELPDGEISKLPSLTQICKEALEPIRRKYDDTPKPTKTRKSSNTKQPKSKGSIQIVESPPNATSTTMSNNSNTSNSKRAPKSKNQK